MSYTKDTWNEYRSREYIGHLLDDRHFKALIDCSETGKAQHSVQALGAGCLDAPKAVPFVSTLCIKTLGKYYREEYNRRSRQTFSHNLVEIRQAESRLAATLSEILDEET